MLIGIVRKSWIELGEANLYNECGLVVMMGYSDDAENDGVMSGDSGTGIMLVGVVQSIYCYR